MHLTCRSTFGKRINRLVCGSRFERFPKVKQYSSCMDKATTLKRTFCILLIISNFQCETVYFSLYLTIVFAVPIHVKPIFHLATLFARRETKTRFRQRDWLKLAGEKSRREQVGSVPTTPSGK